LSNAVPGLDPLVASTAFSVQQVPSLAPRKHNGARAKTVQPCTILSRDMPTIAVGYGDRTLKKASFSKEGTFGPGFGWILMGKASNSAEGRPEARF
jgi:hypothetical protein